MAESRAAHEHDHEVSVIRAGVLVTAVLAGASAAYLALTPDGSNRGAMLVIVALAAVDALVIWMLRDRLSGVRSFAALMTWWNAAHVVVGGVLCALDGGAGSPFVAIFFVSVAFAAVALPKRSVMAIAALDVLALLAAVAFGSASSTHAADAVVWAAALIVTAAVCALIVDERARRVEALGEAKEEMLRRLARVVEFRDDDTAGHVERMSAYAEAVARRLGVHDLTALRLASTMHDIGKVAVPDAILLKPGRLEPEERAIMELHAATGHRMLSGSGSDVLNLAATIALTHHERYDGNGYPAGLAGDDIPLAGRIVAVADVFDALTSDRVYKKAISVDEAVAIIRAESGAQFDPAVVEAFLASLDEIRAIKARDGAESQAAAAAPLPRPERRDRHESARAPTLAP